MRQLFQDLAVCRADGSERRWRQGLPYSVGLHALALGALIVVPLLGEEPLPPVERRGPIVDVWQVTPPAGGGGGGGRVTPPSSIRRRTAIQAPALREPTAPPLTDDVATPGDSPLEPDADVGSCLEVDCQRGGTGDGGGFGEANSPVPDAPSIKVVRAHVDVQPPTKIHDVAPAYPEMARQIRVQGVVVIECMIAPNGRVVDARVLSGHVLLVEAALEAVNQWVYTPTRLNGVPVSVLMTVTVKFRLR